jgi:hypothetical protein
VVEAVVVIVSVVVNRLVDPLARRLVGSIPMKKIRIKVVILRDEQGPMVSADQTTTDSLRTTSSHALSTRPTKAHLEDVLDEARSILEDKARVTFKPRMPPIEWREDIAPASALDPPCPGKVDGHWSPYWKHLSGDGGNYLNGVAGAGGFHTIIRTLTVFITRDGTGGGCSIGPMTNYASIDHGHIFARPSGGRLLAHELGHACNLLHRDNKTNLMHNEADGRTVTPWQRNVIRTSGRVTYF